MNRFIKLLIAVSGIFFFADSFAQAAGIIENYYGSELINIQKLELFEESDLILMPQSCIDEYKRREFSAETYGTDISAPCDAEDGV